MGDVMSKEVQEFLDTIENDCLESTNMSKEQALSFAFGCWQLGYEKVKKCKIVETIIDGKMNRKCSNCNRDLTVVTSHSTIKRCIECGAIIQN